MQIKRTPFEDKQRGFGSDKRSERISAEDEAVIQAAERALDDEQEEQQKEEQESVFTGGCGCFG